MPRKARLDRLEKGTLFLRQVTAVNQEWPHANEEEEDSEGDKANADDVKAAGTKAAKYNSVVPVAGGARLSSTSAASSFMSFGDDPSDEKLQLDSWLAELTSSAGGGLAGSGGGSYLERLGMIDDRHPMDFGPLEDVAYLSVLVLLVTAVQYTVYGPHGDLVYWLWGGMGVACCSWRGCAWSSAASRRASPSSTAS